MKKSLEYEKGFGVIEFVLIILVISLLIGIGWFMYAKLYKTAKVSLIMLRLKDTLKIIIQLARQLLKTRLLLPEVLVI
jgi:Tfp pilus assembly protein PilE